MIKIIVPYDNSLGFGKMNLVEVALSDSDVVAIMNRYMDLDNEFCAWLCTDEATNLEKAGKLPTFQAWVDQRGKE